MTATYTELRRLLAEATPEAGNAKAYCCEVCWRNPTCGNDCGSCDGETMDELLEQLAKARTGTGVL